MWKNQACSLVSFVWEFNAPPLSKGGQGGWLCLLTGPAIAEHSHLTHELKRIRQQPGELDDEPGGVSTVDDTVIVRQRQRKHQSKFRLSTNNHLLLTRARHSQNRNFG